MSVCPFVCVLIYLSFSLNVMMTHLLTFQSVSHCLSLLVCLSSILTSKCMITCIVLSVSVSVLANVYAYRTLCVHMQASSLHRVSEKTVQNCFYQNFVKCPPILITFGR